MSQAQRKHVTLSPATVVYLVDYQRKHSLSSFSAAVEAAADSLRMRELEATYQRYEEFYSEDLQDRREAEAWLALPMDES